jgi:anti-sigma factor (TIGR02949 family)
MTDYTDPIDCTAAARQLWDCLDGELTPERMHLVHEHLSACERCFPHYDFGRVFLDALASTRSESAAPSGLRQRIVLALREEGFSPG